MYEALTKYIGQLGDAGTWIIDRENDGSEEHPIRMPYLSYSQTITRFISEMDAFMVYNYQEVLKRNGLQWGMEMGNADVSGFDAEDVLALLTGAIRAERFLRRCVCVFCPLRCNRPLAAEIKGNRRRMNRENSTHKAKSRRRPCGFLSFWKIKSGQIPFRTLSAYHFLDINIIPGQGKEFSDPKARHQRQTNEHTIPVAVTRPNQRFLL